MRVSWFQCHLLELLLRLAAGPGLYLPKWTDQIMTEVSRTLQESFGLTPEKAQYRESELRRYFPEAWVEGYEDLIPAMTNHEKDRHVLAAAVKTCAEIIVTYNLRDFPDSSLAPYSIIAQGPSSFLTNLHDMDPPAVMQTLDEQAEAIGRPLSYLLSRLCINVPGFAATNRIEERLRIELPPVPPCVRPDARRWNGYAVRYGKGRSGF